MKKFSILSVVLVGVMGGLQEGKAEDLSWSNVGAGDWSVGGNWGGDVPTFSDNAFIANSGTATVGSGVDAAASSLSISAGHVALSGGALTVTGTIGVGANGSLTVSSGTIVAANISGGGGQSALTLGGGTLRAFGSSETYLNGFTTVTLTSNENYIDTAEYDLVSDASMTGFGGFVKEGSGSLTLYGSSDYNGYTVLNGGTLRVDGFSALGESLLIIDNGTIGNSTTDAFVGLGENNVLVNNDFTIDVLGEAGGLEFMNEVDMGDTTLRTITLSGEGLACFGGTITAENLTFVTNGNSSQLMFCDIADNAITGTVRIGSGIQLELWKIDATAISGDLVIDAGAEVHLLFYDQFASTSNVEVNGLLQGQTSGTNSFFGLTGTGTINSSATGETFVIQSGTFAGTVADGDGDVTLIKEGANTLALSGSNSYSGGTIVNGGTMRAEANHAFGTGTIAVGSNATLHVEESIALETGAITLETDGTATYRKDFANGESLSNFNALNSNGSHQTTAEILAGDASSTLEVTASFSDEPPTPATNDQVRISDVFSLSGTDGELFVMQLSFTEASYLAVESEGLIISKLDLFLGRLEGGSWSKLEDGFFVDGAWNLSYMTLGTYGVDRDNNTVWAVTNKEGDISVVPEPSTWLLLGVGLALLTLVRKRKAGTE